MEEMTTNVTVFDKVDYFEMVKKLRSEYPAICFDHASYLAGYIKAGKCKMVEYNGRFGEGYKIMHSDYRRSTRYLTCEYWIVKENANESDT